MLGTEGQRRAAAAALALTAGAFWTSHALAQQSGASGRNSKSSSNEALQAADPGKAPEGMGEGMGNGMEDRSTGSYPKWSLDTLVNAEVAGMAALHPPGRGPGGSLRFDTRAIYNFTDSVLLDALFQFKPRAPRPDDDPNRGLYVNQGAGREEGGKFKELYVRSGDYRIGKFVQNFGRAYLMLPGPYAADFIEESDDGYEPSEMVGVEKLHVFDKEDHGWRQLSVSAFMADRSVLHRSYPYDEGRFRLHDGGLGNTRLPHSVMITYDVMNQPVGNWGQITYQASAIKWGKPVDAERGELWTTVGADVAIPIHGSVASTIARNYSQVRVFVEATRRDNFKAVAGRARDYLSASTEYLNGQWVFDLTTTQRWTTDNTLPLQRDFIYTSTVGYKFPEQSMLSFSVANEVVDHRRGVYVGIRFTKTLTTCSRCAVKESAY